MKDKGRGEIIMMKLDKINSYDDVSHPNKIEADVTYKDPDESDNEISLCRKVERWIRQNGVWVYKGDSSFELQLDLKEHNQLRFPLMDWNPKKITPFPIRKRDFYK